jgi:replicative DNA helicase
MMSNRPEASAPPPGPEARTRGRVLSGFQGLDALTQGFRPGDLIVLAGRPGTGTKTLALNWLLRAASLHGVGGALFALAMGSGEARERLLSAQAGVDRFALRTGTAPGEAVERWERARGALATLPLLIEGPKALSVRSIQDLVTHDGSLAGQPLGLVLIDSLHLLAGLGGTPSARGGQTRILAAHIRALKQMAQTLGLPVVVVTRLRSLPWQRVPKLGDLPGAGAIGAAADLVLLLHSGVRPLRGEAQEQDRSAALIVAKHRQGPIGRSELYFEFEYARFRDLYRTGGRVPALPSPVRQ